MMKVALGTTSADKLQHVTNRLLKHGIHWSIEPIQVSSGISDQPLSTEETTTGAINRAKAALAANPKANIGIGMEGGLEKIGNVYNLVSVVAVWDGSKIHTGQSNFTPLPGSVSQDIQHGGQFDQLIRRYQLTAQPDELERVNQLISRQQSFSQAIDHIVPHLKSLTVFAAPASMIGSFTFNNISRIAFISSAVLTTIYFLLITLIQVYSGPSFLETLLPAIMLLNLPAILFSLWSIIKTTEIAVVSGFKISVLAKPLFITIFIASCLALIAMASIYGDAIIAYSFGPASLGDFIDWLYALFIIFSLYAIWRSLNVFTVSWIVLPASFIGLFWISRSLLLITNQDFSNLSLVISSLPLFGLSWSLVMIMYYKGFTEISPE